MPVVMCWLSCLCGSSVTAFPGTFRLKQIFVLVKNKTKQYHTVRKNLSYDKGDNSRLPAELNYNAIMPVKSRLKSEHTKGRFV